MSKLPGNKLYVTITCFTADLFERISESVKKEKFQTKPDTLQVGKHFSWYFWCSVASSLFSDPWLGPRGALRASGGGRETKTTV